MAKDFLKVTEGNMFPDDWKTMQRTPRSWMREGDLILVCHSLLMVCYRKVTSGIKPVACKYRDVEYRITPVGDGVQT